MSETSTELTQTGAKTAPGRDVEVLIKPPLGPKTRLWLYGTGLAWMAVVLIALRIPWLHAHAFLMLLSLVIGTYVVAGACALYAYAQMRGIGSVAQNITKYLTINSAGVRLHNRLRAPGKTVTWSDVRYVGLRAVPRKPMLGIGRTIMPNILILDCQSLRDAEINLDELTPTERQNLFYLLSQNIRANLMAPQVLFLETQTLAGNENANLIGFTSIWEEEFNSRFGLANHVTLKPGTVCCDGLYTITMLIECRISTSIYLAKDKFGKPVVIKELVAPVAQSDALTQKLVELFNREALTLVGLKHPNIVEIFDHFVENGRSYLVLQSVIGKNLREYVRTTGKLTDKEVIKIALQLASVLAFLHSNSPPVLHRDFAPDNIIYVPEEEKVTVIDFGAANIFDANGTATLIGKQNYMPPEQFKGKPTPASDIYALGATVLFMVSGEDPPPMGRISKSFLAGNDSQLNQLILSCTTFEQVDRPTAQQVIDQLKTLERETPNAVHI